MYIFGLEFFKRLTYRRAFGAWCKHLSWTPWFRIGDDYRSMKQCEGCGIRRMK